MKTLAIRLEDDLHARLSIVAQLQDSTITEEIRVAIENHIELIRSHPELTAKADAVLEELEREAQVRRGAIAALFGDESEQPPPTKAAKSTRKARSEPPDS